MSTPLIVTFSISPLMSTLPSSTPVNRVPHRFTARNCEPLRST